MKDALLINLPFPGFYDSWYSQEIDRAESDWCEWRATEDSGNDDDEARHPEAIRLNAGELAEILWRCTDHSKAYAIIARDYVDAFGYVAESEADLKLGLTFESMTSPREYNFETDRIFAFIPRASVAALFKLSRADKHATLARTIAKRFTSYDGFLSGYPNALGAWLSKPLGAWDHNELGTLLIAVLEMQGTKDLNLPLFERVADDCGFEQAWETAVDWAKFEDLRTEARADKVAELREEDPAAFAEYEATPYRCPYTLDLFA